MTCMTCERFARIRNCLGLPPQTSPGHNSNSVVCIVALKFCQKYDISHLRDARKSTRSRKVLRYICHGHCNKDDCHRNPNVWCMTCTIGTEVAEGVEREVR